MILNAYEKMIAKRYLLPGKGEGFIFVVVGFSVGAVAYQDGTRQPQGVGAPLPA